MDVVNMLRKAVDKAGSQRDWARANNVSDSYLSDVLTGRRKAGPRILRALRLRVESRVVKA